MNASIKDAVQTRVTELTVYDGILGKLKAFIYGINQNYLIESNLVSLPSLVFCLFMGPWSDYHGRKLVMLLPFVGNLVNSL